MIKLIFNPNESLEMLKEYYPDKWKNEIEDFIQIILGVAKTQKLTISDALTVCLKIQTNVNHVIRYEAAFKFLQSLDNINSYINEITNQLLELSIQSALIEQRIDVSPKERSFTRQALYKKIKTLKMHKKRLRYAQNEIYNLPVTATIIKNNGSEDKI